MPCAGYKFSAESCTRRLSSNACSCSLCDQVKQCMCTAIIGIFRCDIQEWLYVLLFSKQRVQRLSRTSTLNRFTTFSQVVVPIWSSRSWRSTDASTHITDTDMYFERQNCRIVVFETKGTMAGYKYCTLNQVVVHGAEGQPTRRQPAALNTDSDKNFERLIEVAKKT